MMSLNGLRFPIGTLFAEYGLKDEADAAARRRRRQEKVWRAS